MRVKMALWVGALALLGGMSVAMPADAQPSIPPLPADLLFVTGKPDMGGAGHST